MWTIPSRYTLPSEEEVTLTKIAINDLQLRLQAATQSPNGAELSQELEQRTAWIAPVRRVPHDILSIIFLESCCENWRAPFIVGGVCHKWRSSIIDNPKAWSLVHLDGISSHAVPIVILRGTPYPLNVHATSTELIGQLGRCKERIRCLKVEFPFISFIKHPFLNLEKLAIRGTLGCVLPGGAGWLLNGTSFPNLRALDCGFLFDSITDTFPSDHIFPPINELGLSTHKANRTAVIICRLAPQLTMLWLVYAQLYPISPSNYIEISFPRLVSLTVVFSISARGSLAWPFKAQTPVIHSYTEVKPRGNDNIHMDTGLVKQLGYLFQIDFKRFPQVLEIWSRSSGQEFLLNYLEANPQALPHLRTIHCKAENDVEKRISSFNRNHGRAISLNLSDTSPLRLTAPHTSAWPISQTIRANVRQHGIYSKRLSFRGMRISAGLHLTTINVH